MSIFGRIIGASIDVVATPFELVDKAVHGVTSDDGTEHGRKQKNSILNEAADTVKAFGTAARELL